MKWFDKRRFLSPFLAVLLIAASAGAPVFAEAMELRAMALDM
jgi:hypothetical protein